MKNNSKIICILLIVTLLFGIFSAGCSAEINKPEIKVDSGVTHGSENTSEQGSGETINNPEPDPDPETPASSTVTLEKKGLDTFESEKELLDYISEHMSFGYWGYHNDGMMIVEEETMAEDAAEAPTASYNGAMDTDVNDADREVSSTNLVDENVDEGDILKTDGDYIYIIRGNELITVSAKGKETEVLSYYKLFPEGDGNVSEMYIKGDKAVVIAQVSYYEEPEFSSETSFGKPVDELGEDDVYETYDYYYRYSQPKSYSAVYVIDLSDREKPREEATTLVEGYLLSSRETNGKIYLVANKYLNYYYYWDNVGIAAEDILPGVYDEENGFRTVEATSVVRPVFDYVSNDMMTIAVIDYLNGAKAETVTILGSGSDIYMTAESLYIFGNRGSDTCVAKYAVDNSVSYVASVTVPGYTATDFSYNEYNGKFRIATTTYTNNGTENNVYVYDANLIKTGELTGLAPQERIYSVRFTGDVAYVVTFRQTDPLFVIDMSGENPKVTGELKIPGFSTYLHPVGEGLLLGIGKETQDNEWTDYYGNKYTSTYTNGLKISLFDVSDPFNPKEIDVENYVGGEYASADVWDNHRAFVFSNVRNDGYFAIDTENGNGFVRVTVEKGELTSKTVIPSWLSGYKSYSGYNVSSYNSRVCYVDDVLYFYQYSRITVYDRNTLEEIALVTVK